jgi:hypothetical protein
MLVINKTGEIVEYRSVQKHWSSEKVIERKTISSKDNPGFSKSLHLSIFIGYYGCAIKM